MDRISLALGLFAAVAGLVHVGLGVWGLKLRRPFALGTLLLEAGATLVGMGLVVKALANPWVGGLASAAGGAACLVLAVVALTHDGGRWGTATGGS